MRLRLAALALLVALPALAQELPPATVDDGPVDLRPPEFRFDNLTIEDLPIPMAPGQPIPGEASAAEEISDEVFGPRLPKDDAYGAFQRGYYLTALSLALPRAEDGDTAAQTLIAEIYAKGLGVAQNLEVVLLEQQRAQEELRRDQRREPGGHAEAANVADLLRQHLSGRPGDAAADEQEDRSQIAGEPRLARDQHEHRARDAGRAGCRGGGSHASALPARAPARPHAVAGASPAVIANVGRRRKLECQASADATDKHGCAARDSNPEPAD